MEFSIDKKNGGNEIIVYGAGIFGEYTKKALDTVGIAMTFFCDRKKCGGKYLGITVISPDELVSRHSNASVLVAVGIEFTEVFEWLSNNGIKNIFTVRNLIFDTAFDLSTMSIQARDKEYYKMIYDWGVKSYSNREGVRIPNLDLVITQKCSLRCRDCSNLMPYFKNPINYDLEEIRRYLQNLFSVVDEILDLRIIGGEPFMNKDIGLFIEEAIRLEKVDNVTIYTNATILPDKDLIETLKNKKVRLEITDYGSLASNYNKFVEIIQKESIRHNIVELTEWHDLGGLYDRNINEKQRAAVYSQCYCRNLYTFMEGKVFRCPYSANGRVLEAIPYKEEDYCDFTETVKDIEAMRRKMIMLLFKSESDYACSFCSGRNNHKAVVKPAIQTKECIPYQKYYE